jgi:thymidylate synthase
LGFLERYKQDLRELLEQPLTASVTDPESVGSDWGREERPFRELLGRTFVVDSDDDVLIRSKTRPVNIDYALVSSVWILLGRNDLAALMPFNPRGASFSADGFTLSAAFGHRLRALDGDQVSTALQLIRADPSTRRAVCMIGRAGDLVSPMPDFPCASLIQYFRRADALHAVVYMRSQSLFGVFPYDVVNFRYLQWIAARQLGARLGSLHMTFGSLHVYEKETERVRSFLSEDDTETIALPELDWDNLDSVIERWLDPATGTTNLRAFLAQSGVGASTV